MKKEVILLVFFICIPISYAEVIDIPETGMPPGSEGRFGTTRFVYAGNDIVASIHDSYTRYFHRDRLSNRLLTGSVDEDIRMFKSLPFGQEIENQEISYPFTGKEEDESSLYYFGARYYDDNLGRFTGADPVLENHAYSYVRNNPMNLIDPTGMDDSKENKVESLYFYSVDTSGISRYRPIDMNPLFIDTFATDPSDTTNMRRFEDYLDSMIVAASQDTTGGGGQFGVADRSDYYSAIYLAEPDTLHAVSSYDLSAIPIIVKEFAEQNSPIENLIITFHGMPLDSIWQANSGIAQDYAVFAQASDSTASLYSAESMNEIFFNIDPAHLADNSRIIFGTCYGSFCVDSQAIADSLDTSVYTATSTVTENILIYPTLVWGNYDRYHPKN